MVLQVDQLGLHLHLGLLEHRELQLGGQHLGQTSSMQLFEVTHGQRRRGDGLGEGGSEVGARKKKKKKKTARSHKKRRGFSRRSSSEKSEIAISKVGKVPR